MKNTTTITKLTCDFCGKECVPVTELRDTVSWDAYGQYKNEIIFKVNGNIPYGADKPDICYDCVKKYIKYMFGILNTQLFPCHNWTIVSITKIMKLKDE